MALLKSDKTARAAPNKCHPCLRVAEHAGLEPCDAERTARVESLHQADEVGMALAERSDCRYVRMEDLAPVRACLEGGKGIFDLGDHLLDRVWLALPGEVDGDGVFLVVHAHPQSIRRENVYYPRQRRLRLPEVSRSALCKQE